MRHRKRMQKLFFTCFIFVQCIIFAACSASQSSKSEPSTGEAAVSHEASSISVQDSSAAQEAQAGVPTDNKAADKPAAQASGVLSASHPQARKMIYKANLNLEVENYTKARSSLSTLVTRFQGYILSSSDYESDTEKGGSIVVRIPQAGFSSFLDELEKHATKIPVRSIEGQDVTEEYVDLSSRLKARQAVEARLLQFMADAKKTEDLLKISNDLAAVQEEIERIKGRMRYLDENVSYSTISLMLIEKKVTAKLDDVADPGTWQNAWLSFHRSLLAILSFLKGLIVFIAGAIPVLVFFAIVSIPVLLYIRRHRKKNQTPPPPSME